jgi:hypothetical protein
MEARPQMSQADNLLSHLDKVKQTGQRALDCALPGTGRINRLHSPSANWTMAAYCFTVSAAARFMKCLMRLVWIWRHCFHRVRSSTANQSAAHFLRADVLARNRLLNRLLCAHRCRHYAGRRSIHGQADRDRLILATERIQAGLTAAGVQRG